MVDDDISARFKLMRRQGELFPERGGKREGAGRKKIKGRHDADHLARPWIKAEEPLHVVLRALPGVPRLRSQAMFVAIRNAMQHVIDRHPMRIVHLSIQGNHLHMIVEAQSRWILTTGMQAFAIVAARGINRAANRRGKVWAFRYHATPITSPRQMRNVLVYVLNNWRKHDEDRSGRAAKAKIDPYSTAIWFGHWKGVGRFTAKPSFEPLPMANPTVWLLTTGWLRHGDLDPFERPKRNK